MSLLSWVGKVFGLRDGQFWGMYYGGETWAGRPVNEENSLQLSAWWRCVRLYADVVGAMPLKFYERLDNDDRIQNRNHHVAGIIGLDPNLDQTAQEFWGGMSASLAMLGNAYAEKRFNDSGTRVVALDPLPCDTYPDRRHSKDGTLEYRVLDRGREEWLPREKVLHIRGFNIGKGDIGMSPLAAGRQGLSIALATEEATGKTFSQGLRTGGFFTGAATPTQRDQIEKTYIEPMRGNDAKNYYGIMPPGFDFKPISIHPKDAELLQSRRYNGEEICRFMGVPGIIAGFPSEGQTMWGTGVEAIINNWRVQGLDAFLTAIEQSVNKRLLTAGERRTYYCEFERNSLMRLDSAARVEFMSKMIQNGLMTPNEGRKKNNDLPKPGGDVLLINSTLVPLTQAGRPQVAPAVPVPKAEPQAISVNVPIMLQGKIGPEITEIEHDKKGRAVRMIKHQE